MKRSRWLSRELVTGPYLTLCTNDEQFRAALKHLKVKSSAPWIPAGANACVGTYDSPGKGVACIVCIHVDKKRDAVSTVGILVHEAVHVWQSFRDAIHEDQPSAEFEAYSIQAIAMRLIEAYPNPKEKKHAKVNAR